VGDVAATGMLCCTVAGARSAHIRSGVSDSRHGRRHGRSDAVLPCRCHRTDGERDVYIKPWPNGVFERKESRSPRPLSAPIKKKKDKRCNTEVVLLGDKPRMESHTSKHAVAKKGTRSLQHHHSGHAYP